MYLPAGDRHLVITPQLALRVAMLGGVALLLFAIVFFRLWYLQVLSGDRYLAEARDNRVREIKVEAPRGKIVDRNGTLLVDNRTALTVQVQPQQLPRDKVRRTRVIRRLSTTLGLNPGSVRRKIRREARELPYSPVTLKTDVGLRTVFYIQENQSRFHGVEVKRVFLRRYPYEEIGAHLFGTTGEVTKQQLELSRYGGVTLGDRVGQSGIEYAYDRYLRGRNGASRVQVDALGRPKGELSVRTPTAGGQLRLSIDLAVQKAGQRALQSFGLPGAFVAMDPRTGEVLGLGSNPSFDPNVFAKGVRRSTYKRLTSAANGAPLANRAIQGLYPTGSAFKLITATGAVESGLITPSTVLFDGGSLSVGGLTFKNAGGVSHGALALPRALQVSSDVFFYRVGLMADQRGGNIIQKWARRLGLGRPTGIDLPGEVRGLVPSPAWRNRLFRKKLTDRPWTPGDNINLAVGQGDLQANPLQMAVAYSAIANGGHVVTPHIGMRVEDSRGSVIQEIQPGSQRNLKIAGQTRSAILSGLRAAANDPGGTSTPVFEGFPITVAGKTGTAERGAQGDQSWYASVAPYGADPRIVVAVTVERGGFGAEAAAPAARRILAAYFGIKGKKAIGRAGSSPD
jgi:penicillin-binding protein 2